MSDTASQYIPGVCNIGPAERRIRRMSGIIATIVGVSALILLIITDAAWAWRLVLVVPFSAAASGFLQDALHFCAGFGMRGIYNVINSAGITDNVAMEEFRQKDRRKALLILWGALGIGTVVTALSLLL